MTTVEVPNFIGLAGRKRAGKDTAADVLVHMGFQQLSFAAPIKHMLSVLLQYQGVDVETVDRMLDGDLKEEPSAFLQGRTPRYAMQTLGTEWGRVLMGDGIWIDTLIMAAQQFPAVVVSDVRFPNEVTALKERCKAQIFRINRPATNPTEDVPVHASEAQIDDLVVDQEIENSAPSAGEFQKQFFHILVGPEQGDIQ